jgi:hypothetical protein
MDNKFMDEMLQRPKRCGLKSSRVGGLNAKALRAGG